ncbi:MAG TPA: EthD family reductase [Kofleriaceae bacterium]|nr:EthD family reductase [Kofleriaceae bacterium]
MTASLFVMYPHPSDPARFDRQYAEEHLPLAAKSLGGVTRVVTHPVLGTPEGKAPYHRITEVVFESMAALEKTAASEGGAKTFAHARSMSTGGAPLFVITQPLA